MKYGTFFAYWVHEWHGDYKYYAKKVADIGFDVLEISAGDLLTMSDTELAELKAVCDGYGLAITSNIGPAKKYDVAAKDASTREAGIKFLTDIMKQMTKVGSKSMVGVTYTYWPNDFSDLDKAGIWGRSVESMRRMCDVADECDVDMCLEVVNRFETTLLNTAEEGVRYCRDVDKKRAKLLLDTFHMNIEEDSFAGAFRTAGDLLGHVHLGEANRKLPGEGRLPWDEIGAALREIGYTGNVVMEPFMMEGGAVGRDIKVWRDLSDGADEAMLDAKIKRSLEFLHTKFD